MKIRLPQGISLSVLLSVFGIAFTLVLTGIAFREAIDYEKERFHTDAETIYDSLNERISALGEVATSLSTLVSSTPRVDADQFRIFAETIKARHPYLACTAYLPQITAAERESFERERRDRGFITFEIKNRGLGQRFHRAPVKERYFPIAYFEPFEPDTAALIGLDVLGEREYGQAARRAIVTGKISLAPDDSRDAPRTGNFLFAPIYAGKIEPTSSRGRETTINGLIAIGLRPQLMLKDAIRAASTSARWRILDHQGRELVAATYSSLPHDPEGFVPFTLTKRYIKDFYGNSYELVISRPLPWLDMDYTTIFLVAMAGSVITLLLALAGRQISIRRRDLEVRNREIEKQVAEKTAALRESNKLLRLEMEERQRVAAELRNVQKMEAIGRLAGGIAHDFNNLLAAIMGYTELAAMELPSDSSAQADLDQVLKASRRAKKVVQQILQFSRQGPAERTPLQLAPVTEEALLLLRASFPAGIEIETDFSPGCAPVLADSTQIQQVLINLGANAAHAMQEKGGKLRITLGMVQDGYVRLSVSDSGCGMDPEVRDHLFEPYFTTKKIGEGSGMGLAVVHGIVESHHGFIEVESVPGRGSAFHIYFPSTTARPSDEEHRGAASIPSGSETILLVDDEPGVLATLERMLTSLGYQVTAAISSTTALEIFRSGNTDFHLVVTDQAMPQLAGTDLAHQLRELRPEIPVILCTGYSTAIHEGNFRNFGIQALIMKPCTREELGRIVRQVLDRSATDTTPSAPGRGPRN
ncbi:MAG: CHASE domain-containing protein [Desulfobacteraceae bacterium]|nr:CHASE domain-containing protein [Desulfobacteraceae bacterium]